MEASRDRWLGVIAIFKLLKATLLVAAAIGGLKLVHKDLPAVLLHWVQFLSLDPGRKIVDEMVVKASSLSPNKLKEFSMGGLVYACLFATEGTGLWLRKRWGEWLTVIITSSLVPFEVYEIYKHPTAAKVLAMIVNLAIVGYLVYRIRSRTSGE
jgi:uncharacterized membrane protein (DUF2068 family)